MTAVALHKGNVFLGNVGLGAEIFPGPAQGRHPRTPQDKVMFGSDYPSLPYARIFKEWHELGYADAVMEKIFHRNAERVLGL